MRTDLENRRASLPAPGKLPDGTPVVIRHIRPDDEPLMVKFHQSLSDKSVYFRYFSPLKLGQRIAHRRLAQICSDHPDHGWVLVAEVPVEDAGERRIIGVGRLVQSGEANAWEFALLVADRYQGA